MAELEVKGRLAASLAVEIVGHARLMKAALCGALRDSVLDWL